MTSPLPALCSVPDCDEPPRSELDLPEGYTAVACASHRRRIEEWARDPLGAPRGARLIAGRQDFIPEGATVLREVETDPVRVHGVRQYGSRVYR